MAMRFSHLRLRFLAMVLLLGPAITAVSYGAEPDLSERTVRQVQVESAGIGSDLRERIEAAGKLVSGSETAQAMREIDDLLVQARKQMPEDGSIYLSVSSDAQFSDFVKANREKKVLRVSWGVQKLLFLKAFILAEEDPQKALPVLEELTKLAPYSADARCEKGYLLNLAGKYEDALATYTAALTLAQAYAGEKHSQPVALRGSAYSLARLGRLAEARQMYEKSLTLEPDNLIARDGLAALATPAAATTPAAPPAPEKTGVTAGKAVAVKDEASATAKPASGKTAGKSPSRPPTSGQRKQQ